MRSDTKRILAISAALLAVVGSIFAAEEYQARKKIKYCKEYAITALSNYVQTAEYKTNAQNVERSLNASLRETHAEEMVKFDSVLASFKIDDEFTRRKYLECQARLASTNKLLQ